MDDSPSNSGPGQDFEQLAADLRRIVREIRELDDGYALRFDNDPGTFFVAASVVPLMLMQDVPARFVIHIDSPGDGAIWVQILDAKLQTARIFSEWNLT